MKPRKPDYNERYNYKRMVDQDRRAFIENIVLMLIFTGLCVFIVAWVRYLQ